MCGYFALLCLSLSLSGMEGASRCGVLKKSISSFLFCLEQDLVWFFLLFYALFLSVGLAGLTMDSTVYYGFTTWPVFPCDFWSVFRPFLISFLREILLYGLQSGKMATKYSNKLFRRNRTDGIGKKQYHCDMRYVDYFDMLIMSICSCAHYIYNIYGALCRSNSSSSWLDDDISRNGLISWPQPSGWYLMNIVIFRTCHFCGESGNIQYGV